MKKNIKLSGFRKTTQRKAILQYLAITNNHPTLKEIYNAIKKEVKNLSLSTVYQNINILVQHNIIKEINIINMPSRYDMNTKIHYHVICQLCGEINDFNYPVFNDVENVASNIFNYEIYTHSLDIYGVCKRCQNNNF